MASATTTLPSPTPTSSLALLIRTRLPAAACRSSAAAANAPLPCTSPLGLSLEEAAHGIRAVANAAMARAIRAVTVERGRDPRDLTLVAFGGNGGIHATDLARDLGIARIVVPPLAGVFSAVGMLAAELEHIGLRTLTRHLDELRAAELGAAKLELADEVAARLTADGFGQDRVAFAWEADLRHEGQASELTIHFDGDDPDDLRRRFIEEYEKTYGYRDDSPIELVKLRVVGRGLSAQRLDFKQLTIAAPAAAAAAAQRHVHFVRGSAATITEVVPRAALAPRPRRGPLIVEEFDATIVVPPDASAHLDAIGNIVLELS
jgi:N-methylhydantoinase A